MKSEPQWSLVRTSTSAGVVVSALASCRGAIRGTGRALRPASVGGAIVAAPATAAPFKNFRRVEENFRGLLMVVPPS